MEISDVAFLCEVCGCMVVSGDRVSRVTADTCVSDGNGGGVRVEDDHEVVFAVFHAECVKSTYAARECDVVPYLAEARELLNGVA